MKDLGRLGEINDVKVGEDKVGKIFGKVSEIRYEKAVGRH